MKIIEVYNVVTYLPVGENYISAADFLTRINEGVQIKYGCYDSVAWVSGAGVEQFRPLAGANPTHGTIGKITRLNSFMVEINIPKDNKIRDRLIELIIDNHPWEEPVIKITSIDSVACLG